MQWKYARILQIPLKESKEEKCTKSLPVWPSEPGIRGGGKVLKSPVPRPELVFAGRSGSTTSYNHKFLKTRTRLETLQA